jgi:hypothetical protein
LRARQDAVFLDYDHIFIAPFHEAGWYE